MCPLTSNNTVPFTMEAATPTPYKPPAQENLTLSLKKQSHSVIFGPQNRRKKRKNKTKHSDRLAVSMLFSLQRQDLLFWSLTQGDHIAAPHKHCRQVSSRPWGSSPAFFFFLDSPENCWDGRHLPLASSKMPSKQRMFSEPAKILEPISWRTEHQVGPRNPEYLRQESCPLEIIDLQRFFLT